MDDAAREFRSDGFGDGDFAADDFSFDGVCPDNLSIEIDMFLALMEEDPTAAPPPATTVQSASEVGCGSSYQDESSSDQVQMDNALKLRPGPDPLAVELSGEPGSYQLDTSASMCLVGCNQAKLQIDNDPVKMNSDVYHVPENHETHWLKLSTEENRSSIMSLWHGSSDSLVSSDFEQQLQGDLANYKAPLQITGDNLENVNETSACGASTGSSFILDAENSNLKNEMNYIMRSTTYPDSMAHEENFCPALFRSSSMLPYEMLQDAFDSKRNTTGADVMHTTRGSNLTSHIKSISDIPENGWTELFPILCPQSSVSHKEDVSESTRVEAEGRLISARSSCASAMDLGTDCSLFAFSPNSPSLLFDEFLGETKPVSNHQMDMSFWSESSTDSSPLPSSRKTTSGNLDMPRQLHTDSKTTLHSKGEIASWESDNYDKNLTLFRRQKNRRFVGPNTFLHRYPAIDSADMNADSDIWVLDDISCPAKPPSSLPLIKPQAALEHSGFGDCYRLGFGATRLKTSNEMLTLRLALEDLSQTYSEANPPDGSLAVPLLRHQRIALSWMVQKETRCQHCSGGILADDQGLGKTVSTIALILTERSPPSYSYASAAKQDKPIALNLDDDDYDDDDDASGREVKRSQVSSSSMLFGSEMKNNSLTVVKSRPAAGTLVVCPTSVLRQWAEELRNKVTKKANLSLLIYHGSNRTKDPNELAKYDVVLTTYAIVSMEVPKQPLDDEDVEEKMKVDPSGLVEAISNKKRKSCKANMKSGDMMEASFLESARPLARVRWFRVILDEAQSIKNFRTQAARACWGLRAKRRWCLSGTPIQNAVDDIYSYFRFLRYEPYSIYKSFCSNIKIPISRNPVNGYKKLQAVLRTIMLRRTKGTLIDGKPIINLPPKTVTLKKVDFSNDERTFYSILEAESREQFQVYADAGTVKQNYVNILLMLLRLRQACSHPLLVKNHDSYSGWGSSLEMAKRLPKEKQNDLLSCLEVCSAICTICNDSPEDPVVSICGHIFCNQCICGHLTGDENICPSSNCKVRINFASVFSKNTLACSISDLPSDHSGLDTKGSVVNSFTPDSSKIKTALEILRSLPRYECPLEASSVKPDESSEKSYIEGNASLQIFSGTNLGKYSPSTNDIRVFYKQKCATRLVSEKAIVFSQWTGMLDLLETPLKNSSIEYRRLDGTMSIAARDKAVKDFNTLPEVTVMILSLKAASLGLNMVEACHVLLLDLWWNPTTEDQAIDRAHRIGQTRPVTVTRLTVRDTVEDRILSLQEKSMASQDLSTSEILTLADRLTRIEERFQQILQVFNDDNKYQRVNKGNHVEDKLANIQQLSTVEEYQTRFELLSSQIKNWSEYRLVETFVEGLLPDLRQEVKARRPITIVAAISFARWEEERLNEERHRSSRHLNKSLRSTSAIIFSSNAEESNTSISSEFFTKTLSQQEAKDIEKNSVEDQASDSSVETSFKNETSIILPPKEQTTSEESSAKYIEESYINKDLFMTVNSASRKFEDCGTQKAQGQFYSCEKNLINFKFSFFNECKLVPMLPMHSQSYSLKKNLYFIQVIKRLRLIKHRKEKFSHMFLYSLEEVVLGIEWLRTLGEITWDFSKLIMKFELEGQNVILKGKRCKVNSISNHRMEKILRKEKRGYIIQLQLMGVTHLPSTVDNGLEPLLSEFSDIFAEPEELPPQRSHDHRMPLLSSSSPTNVRPYRYPHFQKAEIEKIVQEMLEAGIIHPSVSPYSSPVLLEKKKDGLWRMCVDYRALNRVTIKDKYPIPVDDELLDELGGAKLYTKLDLRSGYHQIRKHLSHLKIIFTILRVHKLFVKKSKCSFDQPQVEYLGHIVSYEGVSVDQSKIQVMLEWPVPHTVKALRGFLGLTGYYHKFVKDYGKISAPLTSLLKKDSFKWNDDAKRAFDQLKLAMSTTPVLALPNFDKLFVIESDASGVGIGAVLMQEGRPIANISKALIKTHLNWSVYDKEMLVIIHAVTKWRLYLIGHRFQIHTDHNSLKHILEQKITSMLQQKWVSKLLGYDYEITYKRGTENLVADALSRLPEHGTLSAISILSTVLLDSIHQEWQEDAAIKTLIQRLQDEPLSVSPYSWHSRNLLYKGRMVLMANSAHKLTLLKEFHGSLMAGHPGVLRTYKRNSREFFWTCMKNDVRKFVVECDVCQRHKGETIASPGLLQPLPISIEAWVDISMDFIKGLPSSHGKTTIFVVVDRLTKYAHSCAMSHPYTAVTVANVFVENVVKLHGVPRSIVSDRDKVFTSQFWKELCRLQQTQLTMSTAYHPQTDGQTEVVNRCLESYLRCFSSDKPKNWVKWLPWAEWWYNTTFHSSTKLTPFEAMYGYPPPAIAQYSTGATTVNAVDIELRDRDHVLRLLKDNLTSAQSRMKQQADKKRTEREFQVGDLVYLRLQPYKQLSVTVRSSMKLAPRFYGPYKVLERIGPVAYRLDLPSTSRIHPMFHVSCLKKKLGNNISALHHLPELDSEGNVRAIPEMVLKRRFIQQKKHTVTE